MKRFLSAVFYIITGILITFVSLIGFASRWAFTTWGDIDMDEIVFHLQNPLEGTGNGMIGDFLLKAALPTVLILAVYIVLIILFKKGKPRLLCSCAFLLLTIAGAFLVKNMIWKRLDMDTWINGRKTYSTFIEDNYADPAATSLTFPEKKRNLIFIYLESMETTYADDASGGAFPANVIPELTKIAMDNEDFSGDGAALNGGVVLPGTAFTTGAIFAQSAGLPLKVSIGANFMDTQSSFFPGVTALGDILNKEGYRQIFLLGSDAVFGGRKLFYQDHGDFEIRDYLYAKEVGWIDPDYEVFWGFEDEKLFSFAKETLTELAQSDVPFNLTLLTVDTHYEDGYVCRLCDDAFGDDQYANVMACSSRQIDALLKWIREQDFYDNTTIILSGDHTTMDTNFCADGSKNYQRKTYTAFINSGVQPALPQKERLYSTFDLFPTTLASLGVTIEGDRLALGTNLFSSRETLLEQFGTSQVKKELMKRSALLEQLEKVDANASEALYERYRLIFKDSLTFDSFDEKKNLLQIRLTNLYFLDTLVDDALTIHVDHIEAQYQENGKTEIYTLQLKQDPKDSASYIGAIDLSGFDQLKGEVRINIYTDDGSELINIASAPFSFE
ncbi:MAG: sulfatase-like hydrolase/transferase [Lachnospiraceae bacterium]|nr:sulfatase-like hydrolase/transferase [Lachnospiraceae bacterium]